MKIQLIRNASLVITIGEKILLVDPMLGKKGSYPPVQNTSNQFANPLTELPFDSADVAELLSHTDAVLLTHLHNDHWDAVARELLPKDKILYCQPEDSEIIIGQGFTNVQAIDNELTWKGLRIARTGGQHGTGKIAERLGPVSGFVIQSEQETIYIAGDTIWCDEVKQAIDVFAPTDIIVNGGGAQFVTGGPIVMDVKDIVTTCNYAPTSRVYVIHLEAMNHSLESRQLIRETITSKGLQEQCFVPDNGEIFIG